MKSKNIVIRNSDGFSYHEGVQAYINLKREVTEAGIFKRSYLYYTFLLSFVFAGFTATLIFMIMARSNLWITVWGLAFAFFAVHIGGIMHDAGHRAMFKTSKWNDVVGMISGALLAQSYSFWRYKHDQHHAHTNQEDEDPDIDIPLLSFTKERYEARTGLFKLLRPYQAWLYYPLSFLVVFSPRVGSSKYFIQNFKAKRWWEVVVFVLGLFVWFILPFIIFPFSKAILLFIVVNAAMGVYFINVFAPNHKGMPEIAKGVKLSFFHQQVLTSRNIHDDPVSDFLYMGLNYQIEHHLFPGCPRNKLHKLAQIVRRFCHEHKIEYTQVSFIETNRIIISELHKIAKESRK